MSTLSILLLISCAICLVSLGMAIHNLALYSPPTPEELGVPGESADVLPRVSVCVPARNEEHNLGACVQSILRSTHGNIEVLVYDDHSTDGTAKVLASLVAADSRVRPVPVEALPAGWNGKQFACHQMAGAAGGEYVLFTDADVRFEPACIRATFMRARTLNADLLSSFPLQRTHTLGEALIVPMIHFLLLSYLPMGRMRRTLDPAASAGCGQFMFARRSAYLAAGGHATCRGSMHDGVMLPRAMRRAGFRTDLIDATSLVSVRMYNGFRQTWRGFAKNAYEGLSSPVLLVLLTVLHMVGHLLPWFVIGGALLGSAVKSIGGTGVSVAAHSSTVIGLALFAIMIALSERFLIAIRVQQRFVGAALHPVGIALLTAIQWYSFYLHVRGKREWKGRGAPSGTVAT